MKILFLSPHKHLIEYLESFGDEVIQYMDKLSDKTGEGWQTKHTIRPEASEILADADFIISYGYRFIISKEITEQFKGKAINLHIGYLPWNRGADPNLWSFLEDTPKGVTIHCLDGHIDTGNIIAKKEIDYDIETDTLKSTYKRLSETMEGLFKLHWEDIRIGALKSMPQLTYHRSRDKEKYRDLLTEGWDTKVKNILGKAR